MDGSLAIEANRQALKRIVAMLVEMAGLADDAPATFQKRDKLAHVGDSPHSGLLRKPPLPLKGGEEGRPASPPLLPLPRRSGERWPAKRVGVGVDFQPAAKRVGEGVDFTRDEPCQKGAPEPKAPTIPRILWRAILALLRPAESAARRLIVAASRGLVVPPPRPRKAAPGPEPMEPLLRKFGLAVMVSPANAARAPILPCGAGEGYHAKHGGGGVQSRPATFPLFDPPRRLDLHGRRRNTVPAHAAPRIFVHGLTEPAPLPKPPSIDDLVSAGGISRRLAALAVALDDLSGQARRFARRNARLKAESARDPSSPRRISPLRRGRPPGGRLARYDPNVAHPPRIREVDEILAHAHSMALYVLENPDTS